MATTSYRKLLFKTNAVPLISAFKRLVEKNVGLPYDHIQIRHRNKGGPRIRERVESAKDSGSRFVKQKKKSTIEVLAQENDGKYLAEFPVDNVWVHKHYPPQKMSIEKALDNHRQFAQPDMLNNMDGILYLKMTLDMAKKKKTKSLANFRQTVELPNVFPFGKPPNVLVICKVEEQLSMASTLGAHTFGTPTEIVKSIKNGINSPKDFDHVLCTPDCANDITPLRPFLREKYPQRARGNISFDLQAMWDQFYNGYTFESQKITDFLGSLQVPLGQVEMTNSELIENFETIIHEVSKNRSLSLGLGPFIKSISVVAPPSPEEFLIKVEDYVPGYKDDVEIDSDDEEEIAQAR